MPEEQMDYRYEAYAEYHMIRQEILTKYFACIKARTDFQKALRRKSNIKRRFHEFIDAMNSLISHYEAKLDRFKDSKKKGFEELKTLSAFRPDFHKAKDIEMALRYFTRIQELIDATGIDRIEQKKANESNAWRAIEDEEA